MSATCTMWAAANSRHLWKLAGKAEHKKKAAKHWESSKPAFLLLWAPIHYLRGGRSSGENHSATRFREKAPTISARALVGGMQERCSTCRRACDRGEKEKKLSTLTRSETRSDGKWGEDVPEKACWEEKMVMVKSISHELAFRVGALAHRSQMRASARGADKAHTRRLPLTTPGHAESSPHAQLQLPCCSCLQQRGASRLLQQAS